MEAWPSYATYAVSFLTIDIIWVNHHTILDRVRRADWPLLFINLVFLMVVAAIPFPTSLLADYLREGHDDRLAAAIYGGRCGRWGWQAAPSGSTWSAPAFFGRGRSGAYQEVPDHVRAGHSGLPARHRGSTLSAELGLAVYALVALFYLFDVLPLLKT